MLFKTPPTNLTGWIRHCINSPSIKHSLRK